MRNAILTSVIATWLAAGVASAGDYKVLDRVPGPDGGWDYARIDAAHNRVLVARGSFVQAVDLTSHAVTAGLAPGAMLHDALPVNGGAEIMVTNGGTASAVFIDAKTALTVATVKTGRNPDAAAFDPKTGLVLAMNHTGGSVTLIDPKAHTVVGTIEVGGALEAGAVDGTGRAFVNVEDKNEIAVLDLIKATVTARYPLPGCDAPTGIIYDAADRLLLSACDGATVVVDAATGKVVQTLATGKGADGIAWDAGRRLAFVSAGRDGTLSVIEIKGGKARIIQTVQTARGARTLAEDPKSGRVYLPSAEYTASATPGGRPTVVPGSFKLIIVGP